MLQIARLASMVAQLAAVGLALYLAFTHRLLAAGEIFAAIGIGHYVAGRISGALVERNRRNMLPGETFALESALRDGMLPTIPAAWVRISATAGYAYACFVWFVFWWFLPA